SNAGALEFRCMVESLEHSKNLLSVFLIKADTIVFDIDATKAGAASLCDNAVDARACLRRNLYLGSDILFGVLECIADQVVKQRLDETGVHTKGRQRVNHYLCFLRLNFFIQIKQHLPEQSVEITIHEGGVVNRDFGERQNISNEVLHSFGGFMNPLNIRSAVVVHGVTVTQGKPVTEHSDFAQRLLQVVRSHEGEAIEFLVCLFETGNIFQKLSVKVFDFFFACLA